MCWIATNSHANSGNPNYMKSWIDVNFARKKNIERKGKIRQKWILMRLLCADFGERRMWKAPQFFSLAFIQLQIEMALFRSGDWIEGKFIKTCIWRSTRYFAFYYLLNNLYNAQMYIEFICLKMFASQIQCIVWIVNNHFSCVMLVGRIVKM